MPKTSPRTTRAKPASKARGARSTPRVASKPRSTPAAKADSASTRAPAARPLRLPRTPKGRRARFFDEPGVDQLFGIVTALTAELSVAFERIETLERVLEAGGALDRARIERWSPDADEARARAAAREALIERVFQVLEDFAGEPASHTD